MAAKKQRGKPRPRPRPAPREVPRRETPDNTPIEAVADFSLEDILEEYRLRQLREETEELSEPEELFSEDVFASEDTASPATPAPEEAYTPAEEPEPADIPDEEPEEAYIPDEESEPFEDTEDTAPDRESRRDSMTFAEIEGFDERDDLFSGEEDESETVGRVDSEIAEEGASDEEKTPEKKKFSLKKAPSAKKKGASKGGVKGRVVGAVAAMSVRSEQRRKAPPPDPEDEAIEMDPRRAARHYAGQMPSIRLRAIAAALVCLLLVWISFSCAFGWPLPGGLESRIRAASLVCLAGQFTVLLLGLDIITSGVMSLFRGRPGAESLIVMAGLASILDTAVLCATGNTARGLPYTVLSCAGVLFALIGAWYTGRGYYDSFMTYFRIKEPLVVSSERLPDSEDRAVVSSNRSGKGFIRRSEEPDLAESMAERWFLPMEGASLIFAVVLAAGSGDIGAFFHIFALLTGLCAAYGWLGIFPLLFARTARHLLNNGAALAGWFGASEIGKSRRLVLSDGDLFPMDAVEIRGIRIMDKSRAQHVIACTGSMLLEAKSCTAPVFEELMRRYECEAMTVEGFTVGEGGARAVIAGEEIRIGTAGFMHLSAVKIPDKLKEDGALYVALAGELAGVFIFNYIVSASVQRALYELRVNRRKPIFAVRDFNVDPLMLRERFGVNTEGFEFPSFPERYRIAETLGEGSSPVAGVMGREGMEPLTDLYDCGMNLYRIASLCAWSCPLSVILGFALVVGGCISGSWAAVSAAKMLLYMLVWLLPGAFGTMLLKK